jgi:deferrochelatase/peroxidase EfeB
MKIKTRRLQINLAELNGKEEINSEIETNLSNWKQEYDRLSQLKWIDELSWLPVLSFVLGTVTSGFFKGIGSDIWEKFRDIFIQPEGSKEIPNFEFKFNYQGIKVKAQVKSDDIETIKAALNNLEDLLDRLNDKEGLEEVEFVWSPDQKWKQD